MNTLFKAINKAAVKNYDERLWSVYIGIYSDEDKRHIESIASEFKCKVSIFDAKSTNIWGS